MRTDANKKRGIPFIIKGIAALLFNRDGGIRTRDPLNPIQTRTKGEAETDASSINSCGKPEAFRDRSRDWGRFVATTYPSESALLERARTVASFQSLAAWGQFR